MIDLNVRAVVHMTGELLPVMKERGGVILTVASVAAFQPTPFIGVYGATKAFALHWSLALNEELRGSGVSTLAVCPGPTSTDFFRRAGLDKDAGPGGSGTTEGVVMASLRALASGRAMVVPGWRNKLLAASSVLATKPMLARMAGIAIGRYRVKRIKT
jgi:short-subunit dehydrogenase